MGTPGLRDDNTLKRLDACIRQLVAVKDDRPVTEVHLAEEDVLWLARTSRGVMLSLWTHSIIFSAASSVAPEDSLRTFALRRSPAK